MSYVWLYIFASYNTWYAQGNAKYVSPNVESSFSHLVIRKSMEKLTNLFFNNIGFRRFWLIGVWCVLPLFIEMGACLSVPRVMTPLGRLSTKVLGWYSAFWGIWHLTLKKQNLLQKSLWLLHILYPVFHINKPLRWRSSRIRCQTCVERWPACSSVPEYFLHLTFQKSLVRK